MTMGDQCRISKLNLVIYNRAIFLLHLSKRKDCKDEGLAQICEKYSSRFCIILAFVRFKIFDHCIYSGNSSSEAKKQACEKRQIRNQLKACDKNKKWKVLEFGQKGFQISPVSEKENNDNLDKYLDRDLFP